MRCLLILLLASVPLHAKNFEIPEVAGPGAIYAVKLASVGVPDFEWSKRKLEPGTATLADDEELLLANPPRNARWDDDLAAGVRHVSTNWGHQMNSIILDLIADNFPNVETVSLTLPDCCGVMELKHFEGLKKMPKLRRLSLKMQRMPLEAIKFLPNPEKLEYLVVCLEADANLRGEALDPLLVLTGLRGFSNDLGWGRGEESILSHALLGPDVARLAALPNIEILDLNARNIRPEHLAGFKKLRNLKLFMAGDSMSLLKGLEERLPDEFSALTLELRLLNDGDLDVVKDWPVTRLVIENCPDLTSEGMAPLAHLTGTTHLAVGRDVPLDASAWDYVLNMTALRELSEVGAWNRSRLHDAIGRLRELKELERIQSDGRFLPELTEEISLLPNLVSLTFRVGDLEGDEIFRHLARLKKLEYLRVQDIRGLDDEALKHLGSMKQLRSLLLRVPWNRRNDQPFTREGYEALLEALPDTNISVSFLPDAWK